MRPFANGEQYEVWTASNCDRCQKSANNNGNCEIETALLVACFGDGEVSQTVGDRMGCGGSDYCWCCSEVEWTEAWKQEFLARR